MNCRHCHSPLRHSFLDLGTAPPSNAYLTKEDLGKPEIYYPLRVMVCDSCWLVQTIDVADKSEFFSADYAYFSSYSSSWLQHSKSYVDAMVERFDLNADSHVVEVAANDGYLLQYFQEYNIPCTGIEPTAGTAAVAREKGIEIIEEFFGQKTASMMSGKGISADLMVANNVLAHVPDINDFVAGFEILLKPNGVATFEFPHLLELISQTQFDTIYHEHFSYLSLTVVKRILETHGLKIFDVQKLDTHGGSLRVFAQRADPGYHAEQITVGELLSTEKEAGLDTLAAYSGFQAQVENIKDQFVSFLLEAKRDGKKVAAYGAAAKGNTLLNFAGIRPDLIEYVVDQSPFKQGKFMPGSRSPIVDEDCLKTSKPDYIFIFPWNLKDEISKQLNYASEWDGKFVVSIPRLRIFR